MPINITDKPEMNVVNVGDELTQDQINAIAGAAAPSSSNVFATMDDVGGGSTTTFEQTVTWNDYYTPNASVDYQKFVQELTNNGMANSAFQDAGNSVAISGGSGRALVTYTITVEMLVLSASTYSIATGGGANLFGTWPSGYTNPLNDFFTGMTPIPPTSETYYTTPYYAAYPDYMSGYPRKIIITYQTILSDSDGYLFPNLVVTETNTNNVDWKTTVHLVVKKI